MPCASVPTGIRRGLRLSHVAAAPAVAALRARRVALRRALYRAGLLRAAWRLPVPVVVVGNITVGGSGKTPLVAALVPGAGRARLPSGHREPRLWRRDRGDDAPIRRGPRRCRGRSATSRCSSRAPASPSSSRAIAPPRRARCSPRIPSATSSSPTTACSTTALARNVEIAVVDAARGLGNGWRAAGRAAARARLAARRSRCGRRPRRPRSAAGAALAPNALRDDARRGASCACDSPANDRSRASAVHGAAACTRSPGIGNPERFFAQLAALGIRADRAIAFPDHHRFTAADLAFAGAARDPDDREGCGKMRSVRRRALLVSAGARARRSGARRAVEETAPWIRSCLKSSSARSPRDRSSTTGRSRSSSRSRRGSPTRSATAFR